MHYYMPNNLVFFFIETNQQLVPVNPLLFRFGRSDQVLKPIVCQYSGHTLVCNMPNDLVINTTICLEGIV
jgi:hypothetical protein